MLLEYQTKLLENQTKKDTTIPLESIVEYKISIILDVASLSFKLIHFIVMRG